MLETLDLTVDIILVLGILVFTALLFISNAVRVDVVAVLVLVVLGVFKLMPSEQLFSGFSSDAVISLIAIMIISFGLENTGISLRAARWMMKFGEEKPNKIIVLLMFITGLLASFMRSLGTAALFLPIISRINARTNIPKSFLLLPMAFCTILGGMLTMVGTGPLIILNSLLKNSYQYVNIDGSDYFSAFRLFDVMPIGICMLVVGMGYLFIASRQFLKRDTSDGTRSGTTKQHFKKYYRKGGDIFELKISSNSSMINKTIKSLEVKLDPTVSIMAIKQNENTEFPPLRGTKIKEGAVIALMGDKGIITEHAKQLNLKLLPKLSVFSEKLHPVRAGLCEAVIPPNSQFVGQEVRELHMRRNHRIHVLALSRGGTVYLGDELNNLVLRSGDTLGMYSNWEALHEFKNHPDFFVLTTTYPREKTYPKKMPEALFFFVLAIVLVLFGDFPISIGLLLGAVGMIATGVISVDQAYAAVSWKTVFLIAGLIPLGLAMQTTGTAEWLADRLIPDEIAMPIWVVESGLVVGTTILALIISNIGATVLMVPIAIDLASNVGADPRIFALAVAIASSNTFIIPTHQVNALIVGPGNYSMQDFIRIGGWMTVLFWVILIGCLQVFF